ncbi:MAG: hypothetical protein ACRDYA_22905 [Egibacteraceae bacterium]
MWADAGAYWPLVVKPPASAGSDSVAFCTNQAEVCRAFASIHGRTDQMGGFNTLVLGAGAPRRRACFVNAVSCVGRHCVHEMWHEQRTAVDGAVVYDRQDLLPPQGAVQQSLAPSMTQVLNALGIAHSPSHSENVSENSLWGSRRVGFRSRRAF